MESSQGSASILTALLMLGMSACSDPIKFSSGLPSDLVLRELPEAQERQYCEAASAMRLQVFLRDLDGRIGRLSSIRGNRLNGDMSTDKEACQANLEAFRDQYLAEPRTHSRCSLMNMPEACIATVGQIEDCADLGIEALRRFYGQYATDDCDVLLDTNRSIQPFEIPSLCRDVTYNCPYRAFGLPFSLDPGDW